MKRNLYLKTISVEEAFKKYIDALEEKKILIPKNELVDIYVALNRITSKAIYAKCNSPLYNLSSMDGICVKSTELKNITDANPKIIEEGKDYKIVDTGDPIYAPFDAVIMAEDLIEVDEKHVKIIASPSVWQNVRPIGEDIVSGEMIIESNKRITATDIGACLASGNVMIECYKHVKVGVIPTGDEIVKPTDTPKIGDIIDSNSGMLAALVEGEKAIAKRYDIVKDDYEKIKSKILEALSENDMVLVNAGSSAGTEDYTVHILKELGEVIVHGVSIKPGKPVILAIVNNKPVIGCPGYPVSSYLAFENFVKPVIGMMQGAIKFTNDIEGINDRENVKASVSKRIVSTLKYKEYVRVKVGKVGDKYVAAPLSRNASSQMSMVKADGFLVIPKNSEGIDVNEISDVKLLKDKKLLEKTLVSIGSHDMLMDIVADMMSLKYGISLSSTHVGSMGGLMALKRSETILAPTHLLDENTGIYNISTIEEIFGKGCISIIKGFNRTQGMIVKKGNPLNIKTIKDIAGKNFVNRQRGAGTRVLFDYLLKKENIDSKNIYGYEKELSTHMAVAAAVSSEDTDVGIGIKSAANAMNLDFIEIGVEEYDFAIHTKDLDNYMVKCFIETINSDELKNKLNEIGGYGFTNLGKIIDV